MPSSALLRKTFSYAVVGASRSPDKPGFQVLVALSSFAHKVFPINPYAQSIAGLLAYPSLSLLPVVPDVVVCITPPPVTLRVLQDSFALGCRSVWLQPGSFDDACIAFCTEHDRLCVHDACILQALR